MAKVGFGRHEKLVGMGDSRFDYNEKLNQKLYQTCFADGTIEYNYKIFPIQTFIVTQDKCVSSYQNKSQVYVRFAVSITKNYTSIQTTVEVHKHIFDIHQ